MTKTILRCACCAFILAALVPAGRPLFAQSEPTAKVIYTLEAGEVILQPESTIAFSAEADDVILVLAKNKEQAPPYFVFREGRKSGPYDKLEAAMAAAYDGRNDRGGSRSQCAVYDPAEPPDEARPGTVTGAGGKSAVRFKGKDFGSYMLVFAALATPDGKAAFYTAADNEQAWFGCTDGRVVSFGGIPEDFKFSPDGRNAAVLVQGKFSMADLQKLGQLPPEKMAAAMQEQDKKFLYTIDGRTFGPFDSGFGSLSFWYSSSSNDLYYRIDDGVYRNGALLFKSDSFDSCQFYPSPDGKVYANSNYERIVFSDGRSYPSPLGVLTLARAGRTVFRWLTLENGRKIVAYERTL